MGWTLVVFEHISANDYVYDLNSTVKVGRTAEPLFKSQNGTRKIGLLSVYDLKYSEHKKKLAILSPVSSIDTP